MAKTKTGSLSTGTLGRGFIAGIELELHECGECGVLWAMTVTYLRNRRQDGEDWRCPAGHLWHYPGETREESLQRELEAARRHAGRLAAERDQIEASRRAIKGQLTKTKRRVAAGVCPCCKRSFANLAKHMQGQHPDYASEKDKP